MTFVIPSVLEKELRDLASREGQNIDALIEQALRRYLDDAAITDLSPAEVAATQEELLKEMVGLEPWTEEPGGDAAQ